MILTVILYLLVSVPILFYLLGWKFTGDKQAVWQLPAPDKSRFFWIVVGFALSLPLLVAGLGCSLFNAGGYIYSSVGRALGNIHGDNYDILLLFALVVSVPMLLVGYFGVRTTWRRIKRQLTARKLGEQPPEDNKDTW